MSIEGNANFMLTHHRYFTEAFLALWDASFWRRAVQIVVKKIHGKELHF